MDAIGDLLLHLVLVPLVVVGHLGQVDHVGMDRLHESVDSIVSFADTLHVPIVRLRELFDLHPERLDLLAARPHEPADQVADGGRYDDNRQVVALCEEPGHWFNRPAMTAVNAVYPAVLKWM
jgi:hypothetical protein